MKDCSMGADISGAEWTRREGLRALSDALGSEHIRWVGGAIRDAVLGNMAHYGRVAVCGLVSAYDADAALPGPAAF